ncbi:MAG: hypothetical protein MUE60_04595 [Candidatus Eisenbacteria bacterium]|nr:hypothetical protein [Candidatus Eisenbacteria bacterium]
MLQRLTFLLVFGLLIACGDDGSSPTTQPPEIVEPSMTFTGPTTSDPNAAPAQAYVTSANAMTSGMYGYMNDLLLTVGTEVQYDDGVWTWTYSDGIHTFRVFCEFKGDGWYFTYTIDGGIYSNCARAMGFTSTDGNSGWWKFLECGTGAVLASATWSGDASSGNADWYSGDFNAGGALVLQSMWTADATSQTTTLTAPSESRIVVTEDTDGSGELYVYDWDDANSEWDLIFEAHWNSNGSGWYTNHVTGNTVNWG